MCSVNRRFNGLHTKSEIILRDAALIKPIKIHHFQANLIWNPTENLLYFVFIRDLSASGADFQSYFPSVNIPLFLSNSAWIDLIPSQHKLEVAEPIPSEEKKKSDDAQGGKSTLEEQIKGYLLLLCYSRDWFLLKTQNWVTCNYIRCFSIWKAQHKQNIHLWMFKKALKIQIICCLKGILSGVFLESWSC